MVVSFLKQSRCYYGCLYHSMTQPITAVRTLATTTQPRQWWMMTKPSSSSSSSLSLVTSPYRHHFYYRRTMADMPVPQSASAKLFEGHSTHLEGWEYTVLCFYSLSTLILLSMWGFSPVTDIETWAQQEAAARLKLKEEHGYTDADFVFGKHYQYVFLCLFCLSLLSCFCLFFLYCGVVFVRLMITTSKAFGFLLNEFCLLFSINQSIMRRMTTTLRFP
jgi:hypothetical protein